MKYDQHIRDWEIGLLRDPYAGFSLWLMYFRHRHFWAYQTIFTEIL